MALEDITSRILDKARQEADRLVQEAQERAAGEKEKVAQHLAHEIVLAEQKAADEAKAAHERIVASAQLEARKQELVAKRNLIGEAVDQALARIAEADEDTYFTFLTKLLAESPFRGKAELIVSSRDRRITQRRLPEIQRTLERAGVDLILHLADQPRAMEGGFVLRQERIEYNASLAAIKRFREQELRSAAATVLFGGTK
jgi:V/A-type H+-transporting ATPase subunit E